MQYLISSINAILPSTALATSTTSGLSYFYAVGSAYGNTGALKTNVPSIVEIIDKGASSTLYYTVPGAAMDTVSSGSASAARDFASGASIGSFYNGTARSSYFNGHIAEIIMFDRALKQEEKSAIDAYLTKKWAIETL